MHILIYLLIPKTEEVLQCLCPTAYYQEKLVFHLISNLFPSSKIT